MKEHCPFCERKLSRKFWRERKKRQVERVKAVAEQLLAEYAAWKEKAND